MLFQGFFHSSKFELLSENIANVRTFGVDFLHILEVVGMEDPKELILTKVHTFCIFILTILTILKFQTYENKNFFDDVAIGCMVIGWL